MAYDVYICYEDNDLNIARDVCLFLEENNINCWFKQRDEDDSYSISDSINKIYNSEICLLILSKNSISSNKVKTVMKTAVIESIPILTFQIDDFEIPAYFEYCITADTIIQAYPKYEHAFYTLLQHSSTLLGKQIPNDVNRKFKLNIFSIFNRAKNKSPKPKFEKPGKITYDAFICYSTRNYDIANAICYTLENNSLKCWFAHRDIGGDALSDIVNAVKNSKFVVLVFSKYFQRSSFAKNDMRIAFKENKPVISLVVDDIMSEDIDKEYLLKVTQWLPAYPAPEDSFPILVEDAYKLATENGLKPLGRPMNTKLVLGKGRKPIPAYRGDGKYIFVSYAHKDANIVFPQIKLLQDLGYNVWYDEGIGAGNEWSKDIVAHLIRCELFIVFVTNNSMASINVQKEIKYAIRREKNIIPIYLEDSNEIEMEDDIDYEFSNMNGLHKTTLDKDTYISSLTHELKMFDI